MVLNQSVLDWSKVLSGVPQGSVLGRLLFVIFINDIDALVVNGFSKFADDTKLFGVVSSLAYIDSFRSDLNSLCKWSQDWLMLFNLDKCKVMHFGKQNSRADYIMGGKTLAVVTEEKDLKVIVQDD